MALQASQVSNPAAQMRQVDAGAYSRTLDQRGGDLVEGAVGPTPGDLAARARDAALPAINAAEAASELIDIEHPIPYCKFRYY